MMRLFWLAVGPLFILGLGLWLIYGQPEEESPFPKRVAGALVLPSGIEAELQEMLWNTPGEGLSYRFRFVAPDFEETEDVDAVMADLQYLCSEFALARVQTKTGPTPAAVIISLADRPSEFGTFNPDVTQVFEAFDIKSGACMWEEF